jgi:hypothetical protein
MVSPGRPHTNGGGSRPLVPIADFRETIDFKKENLRSSTAPRVSVWGRWYQSERDFSTVQRRFGA